MVPPHPQLGLGSSVQRCFGSVSPEGKAPGVWCRGGVGLSRLLRRGEGIGGLTAGFLPILGFCVPPAPYHQRCLELGIPGSPGLPSVLWFDSCWVSIFFILLSLSPLVHVPSVLQNVLFLPQNIVNTSRLLSSPLPPHQFMPLLFLYCHFSEAWGI